MHIFRCECVYTSKDEKMPYTSKYSILKSYVDDLVLGEVRYISVPKSDPNNPDSIMMTRTMVKMLDRT
jgi:hypothetical protein